MTKIIDGLTSHSGMTCRIFNGHTVRFSITTDGPIFVAQDICEALEIRAYRDAIARVPSWGQGCRLGVDAPGGRGKGGTQSFATLTREGVYWLAMRSNTDEAQRFQEWLCKEVLPAIDKQGFYIANGVDPRLARVSEGRQLAERARLLRQQAAELVANANILLTLDDGITVAELLRTHHATKYLEYSPEQIRSYAQGTAAYARRNGIPIGKDKQGRMTLPKDDLIRALGLDQATLNMEG